MGNRRFGRAVYMFTAVVFLFPVFFLTGCRARELESRRFPLALEIGASQDQIVLACAWSYVTDGMGEKEEENTSGGIFDSEKNNEKEQVNNEKITRVSGKTMEETVKAVQNLQDKYVDYSQVKAILWQDSLKKYPDLEAQVLSWLEKTPVFARNILIFDVEEDKLTLDEVQEQSQGQPGFYLENLYNNNEQYRECTRTLEEVLYFPEK